MYETRAVPHTFPLAPGPGFIPWAIPDANPLRQYPGCRRQGPVVSGAPDLQRPLALLVDDDSTARLLAREALELAGFAVEAAEDGVRALSAFERLRPQIVVLDLLMPEMDGFDVCISLREIEDGNRTPVLVMSSLGDIDSINRAYEAGATDFITKPINWMILGHRVRYMVRASRLSEDLRKSEAKNRAILNSLPDAMLRVSKEGVLLEVTPSNNVAWGLSAGECVGKPLREIISAEVAARAMVDIERVLSAGTAEIFEFQLQLADAMHHFETRIVACGENEALCIVRDISEQRWGEEQRAAMEQQLRQAQKMEAIGTLAGGIAHDFNNILSAIVGFTELTLLDMSTESPACRNKLQQVLKASDRAKGLVKQIISFSRQQEEERKPISIAQILKEILVMLRATLPTTVEIRRRIKAESAMVMADSSRIQQVLMNLCTNAAYAMREKGGVLEVSLSEKNLDGSALTACPDLKPGLYLKLSVSDTGTGMDPAVIGRIFDPFFTTKGPGEGSGMGLSVVYGIVKSHGGYITVDSEAGKGSRFDVYFPGVPQAQSIPEPDQVTPLTSGNKRILFVDDEETLRRMGEKMLEQLGYEVAAHRDPLEALDVFATQPDRFDLVITDQTMPHMTGVDLAMEIMRTRPEMPVILVTGFSETITPEKAMSMGIRKFVMKPYEMGQMAQILSEVLNVPAGML